MSDSGSNMIGRIAGLLFFVALGAGIFAFITHDNLQAMEARLASVEQERTKLKNELVGTEKTVLANSADLKSCTKELEVFKSRAQNNDAPQDPKALKATKSPRAAL